MGRFSCLGLLSAGIPDVDHQLSGRRGDINSGLIRVFSQFLSKCSLWDRRAIGSRRALHTGPERASLRVALRGPQESLTMGRGHMSSSTGAATRCPERVPRCTRSDPAVWRQAARSQDARGPIPGTWWIQAAQKVASILGASLPSSAVSPSGPCSGPQLSTPPSLHVQGPECSTPASWCARSDRA